MYSGLCFDVNYDTLNRKRLTNLEEEEITLFLEDNFVEQLDSHVLNEMEKVVFTGVVGNDKCIVSNNMFCIKINTGHQLFNDMIKKEIEEEVNKILERHKIKEK